MVCRVAAVKLGCVDQLGVDERENRRGRPQIEKSTEYHTYIRIFSFL